MTVSVSEMTVPPIKAELIANAEKRVEQFYAGNDDYLLPVINQQLVDLGKKCFVICGKTGRTDNCGNRVPYFDGNPAHQLIAFCLKNIPGLLIVRVPPIILHLNQKQLSIIMNA